MIEYTPGIPGECSTVFYFNIFVKKKIIFCDCVNCMIKQLKMLHNSISVKGFREKKIKLLFWTLNIGRKGDINVCDYVLK